MYLERDLAIYVWFGLVVSFFGVKNIYQNYD